MQKTIILLGVIDSKALMRLELKIQGIIKFLQLTHLSLEMAEPAQRSAEINRTFTKEKQEQI